jgi:hypothetical protein
VLSFVPAEPISINAETDKAMRKPKKEDAPSFVMFQTTTEKLKKDAFNQERKVSARCMAVVVLFSLVRCLLRHLSYVQLIFTIWRACCCNGCASSRFVSICSA